MKIVHISDTHGKHNNVVIPICDLLIHTGDVGNRTTNLELADFLYWFYNQPSKYKIFCAGNHDICLDESYLKKEKVLNNPFLKISSYEQYQEAEQLIKTYCQDIIYLENSGCIIEGLKIWGSPYSPSFHKEHWVFNADKGKEINSIWKKIPKDTNILLTHTPPYDILDSFYQNNNQETIKLGCKDLYKTIEKSLLHLKLHCFGHIHENTSIIAYNFKGDRSCLFSNGAVLNNQYIVNSSRPSVIDLL